MTQTARAENQILMEGMWSRFPPLMRKAGTWLIRNARGNLFSSSRFRLSAQRFESQTVYSIRFGRRITSGYRDYPLSSMILGLHKDLLHCIHCETNVDEQTSCILKYENGHMPYCTLPYAANRARGFHCW